MRRVLALFAAGLLLAGCGSGGSRLSRADYAAREDAICSRYAKRIAALGQPKDLTELSKFASRAVAIARRAIDDARKLLPPKAEQAAVDKWNAENAKVADAIARLGRAAKANDQSAAQRALRQGDAANGRAKVLAQQLGMDGCARS